MQVAPSKSKCCKEAVWGDLCGVVQGPVRCKGFSQRLEGRQGSRVLSLDRICPLMGPHQWDLAIFRLGMCADTSNADWLEHSGLL